jgi:hypothetical protein
MSVCARFEAQGCDFVEPETTKLKGRLQGGYLLHFSTVSGAERAQTGVLGRCGAIGAVILSF